VESGRPLASAGLEFGLGKVRDTWQVPKYTLYIDEVGNLDLRASQNQNHRYPHTRNGAGRARPGSVSTLGDMSDVELSPMTCGNGHALEGATPHTPVELREPCPICGSTDQNVEISVSDRVEFHERLEAQARHGERGEVRWHRRVRSGDDLHRASGTWMQYEQVIDRENDWYEETVTNPETGENVHRTAERLSDHTAHGSAKNRPRD
jgi:hypothetical protein